MISSGADSSGIDDSRETHEGTADIAEPRTICKHAWSLRNSDPLVARSLLADLATSGYVPAMTALAYMLTKSEPARAKGWYERATQAGDVTAMLNLGLMLGRTRSPAGGRANGEGC